MGAPDNIFLFRKPGDVILGTWFLDSSEQFENIEYIRKDAFIEKVVKFINKYLRFEDICLYKNSEQTLKDKVINDFVKSLKEE